MSRSGTRSDGRPRSMKAMFGVVLQALEAERRLEFADAERDPAEGAEVDVGVVEQRRALAEVGDDLVVDDVGDGAFDDGAHAAHEELIGQRGGAGVEVGARVGLDEAAQADLKEVFVAEVDALAAEAEDGLPRRRRRGGGERWWHDSRCLGGTQALLLPRDALFLGADARLLVGEPLLEAGRPALCRRCWRCRRLVRRRRGARRGLRKRRRRRAAEPGRHQHHFRFNGRSATGARIRPRRQRAHSSIRIRFNG